MAARYPLVLNGTTIEELQSVDTLAGVDAFASGTVMLFVQTSAPTGWTKSTTHDNKALRVVSGAASSGGSVAFTTAFSSSNTGATTLSANEMPSHAHSLWSSDGPTGSAVGLGAGGTRGIAATSGATGTFSYNYVNVPAGAGAGLPYMQATGGGGSHSHSLSLAVQYVDVIIATKN